jgi:2-dehydropantoate 2-reductase
MGAVYIVGAGGIGCAVGYALRAGGRRVVFVEANSAKVEAGRRNGVEVAGRPPLATEFVPFDVWTPPAEGLVLLCTKCYDNAAVLARLPEGVTLVPIQNGFDPELLAFGHEFGGIASFVSECDADQPRTRITRAGKLHLGRAACGVADGHIPRGAASGIGDLAKALVRAGLFDVRQVPKIEPYKYTKLMYNAAISPLAAAAGVDNGSLLSDPLSRHWFFALIRENYGILSAAGIELGKVGPFRPATVAKILSRAWLARLMAKAFEPSLRGTYCSMAGEIQKGRTEIDNYNGHLIRLAGDRVPCPLNRAVYELVNSMEQVRAEPRRGVLSDLAKILESPAVATAGH